MILAIVSDQEWFVVELDARIRLEHLDATDEVWLSRVLCGQPIGAFGPTGSFNPVPTRA